MVGTVHKLDGSTYAVEPANLINLCFSVLGGDPEDWAFDIDSRTRFVCVHAPFSTESLNNVVTFKVGMKVRGNAIIFGYADMVEQGYVVSPGEHEEGV